MLVDICSDLHIDHWRKNGYDIKELFKETDSEVLIIAGDISHSPEEIKGFLLYVKQFYKKIFFVIGNHEHYSETSSKEKLVFMKNLFISINKDIHFLDGDIVEYNGLKFGGSCLWYESAYFNKNKNRKQLELFYKNGCHSLNAIYNSYMRDSDYIKDLGTFDEICLKEKEKLSNFYKDVDIIVSHVSPLINNEFFDFKYKGNLTNTFFCFDGTEFVKDTSAKLWVYGHQHSFFEHKFYNVSFVCNPLGYIGERNNFKLITKDVI